MVCHAVVKIGLDMCNIRANYFWDFIKCEFCTFQNGSGSQLTFKWDEAKRIRDLHAGSYIVYFDLNLSYDRELVNKPIRYFVM